MTKRITAEWDELPEYIQADLEAWYNRSELDKHDLARLAQLHNAGRFHAWDCPQCGIRVRSGEPEDWAHFQGVDQPDFSSYPGDVEAYQPEYLARLCDDCRSAPTERKAERPEY